MKFHFSIRNNIRKLQIEPQIKDTTFIYYIKQSNSIIEIEETKKLRIKISMFVIKEMKLRFQEWH